MPFQNTIIKTFLAFVAGAATVFSFAPYDIYPLAVIGPAILMWLWLGCDKRRAFRLGWVFGLGMFGLGVFWMHISIDQFGGVGTSLAVFITLVFIFAMALYYGFVGWLVKRLFDASSEGMQLVAAVLIWALIEWVRGWFLTGFPWLALGYSQLETPLQGFAPLLGVYGVSLMVLVTAAVVVWVFATDFRSTILPGIFVATLVWGSGWLLRGIDWTAPSGEPITVSIIQANVKQSLKWRPEAKQPTIDLYLAMTRMEWHSDLVIWPETAIPAYYHELAEETFPKFEKELQKNQTDLLLGIPVRNQETFRYYNAMVTLGKIQNSYFKRHLVPFGEFMPLSLVLRPIIDFMDIPMSNFAAGDSERPLVKVADYWAGISICYEDAFGNEVIEALPDAAFLVNASNDAWFGDSLALPQHLQIARMRSAETGRYQLRSTNTGISAFIGPKGELIKSSPIFKEHVLRGEIKPMSGITPYARIGNWGVMLLTVLLLVPLIATRKPITERF